MAITAQAVVSDLCLHLHAANVAGLYAWTETDLLRSLAEAYNRLATGAGVWGVEASLTLTARSSAIAIPAAVRRLVGIACAGVALRETTQAALAGIGEDWQAHVAEVPSRFALSISAPGAGIVYPVPWSAPASTLCYYGQAGDLDDIADTVAGPVVLEELLTLGALAGLHSLFVLEGADAAVGAHLAEKFQSCIQHAQAVWGDISSGV